MKDLAFELLLVGAGLALGVAGLFVLIVLMVVRALLNRLKDAGKDDGAPRG